MPVRICICLSVNAHAFLAQYVHFDVASACLLLTRPYLLRRGIIKSRIDGSQVDSDFENLVTAPIGELLPSGSFHLGLVPVRSQLLSTVCGDSPGTRSVECFIKSVLRTRGKNEGWGEMELFAISMRYN